VSTPWKPRTLILQHEEATPPGLMTGWLREQQAAVDTRRIDVDDRAVELVDLVHHARCGRNEVEIVLALQPLLDDLHVQQAEKAAAKAEAQRV